MEIKPFKMRVTPEQSKIVQQILFGNNYTWFSGDTDIKKLSSPHLYFYEDTLRQTGDFQETFFIEHELPELTFQEFFDTYVKWCVKVTEENKYVIHRWKKTNTSCTSYSNPNEYIYYIGTWDNSILPKHVEITFNQFEKYVLKIKNMEKKIIGYKLKEDCEQYKEAIYSIAEVSNFDTFLHYKRLKDKDTISKWETVVVKLIQAGVLDLWFEPVYEESSKELYFGNVKFTIKKGDNFATTEYGKVTKEEISKVFDYLDNPPTLVCGKYPLKFGLHNDYEIKFGCQSGTLGELIAIYNVFE